MGDLELGAAGKAAIEAGARRIFNGDDETEVDWWADATCNDRDVYLGTSELVLTAAYPHIERAVIQRLIAKLDTQIDMELLGGDEDDIIATEWPERALDWLRAELEGGDRG